MNPKVAKRRDFLVNTVFFAAVLALFYLFFKYLIWVTAPFLLTFFFAVLLQGPIRKLDKKTNNKCHTLWCVLLIILVIVIVLIPFIFIFAQLISRVSTLVNYLTEQLNDIPTFLATLENEILNFFKFLPEGIYKSFSETVTSTFTKLIEDFDLSALGINMSTVKNGVSSGVSGIVNVVKNVPSVMIALVIGLIAWIFFTKDYNRIVHFIQLQLPKEKKNLLFEIKQVFSKTILKMIRAYGLIMLITFGELFLGFSILTLLGIMKNPNYIWIAALIAIFDILPVAGSGGILIPWALISLILGKFPQAIGLVVIYIIITLLRQYIEPKIVGDSLGVHPLITLMGLYFGLKIFGFIGMFLVPLTVMTLKAFNDTGRIHLWTSANPVVPANGEANEKDK